MGIMDRFKTASRRWAKTIVAFESPPRLREVGGPVGEAPSETTGQVTREDQFKIRLAHNDERTRDAKFFVEKRYSEAGYHAEGSPSQNSCPDSITLATYRGEQVIGTMTLGLMSATACWPTRCTRRKSMYCVRRAARLRRSPSSPSTPK